MGEFEKQVEEARERERQEKIAAAEAQLEFIEKALEKFKEDETECQKDCIDLFRIEPCCFDMPDCFDDCADTYNLRSEPYLESRRSTEKVLERLRKSPLDF